eukprot:gene9529-biopygen5516
MRRKRTPPRRRRWNPQQLALLRHPARAAPASTGSPAARVRDRPPAARRAAPVRPPRGKCRNAAGKVGPRRAAGAAECGGVGRAPSEPSPRLRFGYTAIGPAVLLRSGRWVALVATGSQRHVSLLRRSLLLRLAADSGIPSTSITQTGCEFPTRLERGRRRDHRRWTAFRRCRRCCCAARCSNCSSGRRTGAM